ncbi:fumarylacetoacetate hydrolase family protein [Streptomyces sp. SID13726]|uniref:2-keto-4-pentenoate hydratase n=1 Tax=Streptomyces sp. SID13726 TaxID=2706058 RepID=UPI0013B86228|nr:fumarylacetoacetate hydrolase family protein [Streptomyces sp. SID13726]NEB03464.1 2-keto-4-pentenoate hydratase [Streptomyces sp. SID13726]
MSLTWVQREEAAALLREATYRVTPVNPLSALIPAFDMADAYAVQRDNIAWHVADGANVIGYKVDRTPGTRRDSLAPYSFGHVLDDMTHRDGTVIRAGRYCRPRVDPEICFLLSKALSGPRGTVSDVLGTTRAVAPALEIQDSRIRHERADVVAWVADNAGSAGLVCGAWTPLAEAPDLAGVPADLVVDGEPVASGGGRAISGHPADAVAWLATVLAERGSVLEPGHVILSGALTQPFFVTPGQKLKARFGPLGTVSLAFA